MKQQRSDWLPGKRVSRADLLLALMRLGEEEYDEVAHLSGFEAPEIIIKPPPPQPPPPQLPPTPDPEPKPPPPVKAEPIHYYRVIERRQSKILPESAAKGTVLPDWYHDIAPINPDDFSAPDIPMPEKEPLVSWARLWPVIQALLSQFKRSRQPDIPKLVKMVANGEILTKIPRSIRQQWAVNVQVLVDYEERIGLFTEDYNRFLEQIQRLRSSTGFVVQQVIDRPGRYVRGWQGGRYQRRKWIAPETGALILILSDLGLTDTSEVMQNEWLRFGKKLRVAGFKPVVLLPLPKRHLTLEIIAVFDCVCWSRQSDLRVVNWVSKRNEKEINTLEENECNRAKDLLAWMSFAVRIEPGLLRVIRHRLPAAEYDVGSEISVWLHESVVAGSTGFYFKPDRLETHRKHFCELARQYPERTRQIVNLICDYHRYVFPTQRHEEMLVLADLLEAAGLDKLRNAYQMYIDQATKHWRRLLKALNEKSKGTDGLPAFTGYYFKRQHQGMWQNAHSEHLPAMWGIMMREYADQPEHLPEFLENSSADAKRLALTFMNKPTSEIIDYVVYQEGKHALKAATRNRFIQGVKGFTTGTPLLDFGVQSQFILNQKQKADGKTETLILRLNNEEVHDFEFEARENQLIHVAGEELTIECLSKPDWADLMGYDHQKNNALFADVVNESGQVFRWYWNVPGITTFTEQGAHSGNPDNSLNCLRGFWYPELLADVQSLRPPEWATTWGRDQYGLYADAEIVGVIQRFRWIEPASFMMGSLRSEAGRYENETQHRVILTQGYWLADTACTKELWEAVKQLNPNIFFEGKKQPIENISWNDIMHFFDQIEEKHPELKLRLPTEAEWENACRAGTETAFHFGAEITLNKVNYRGTWEYESNKWGEGALRQTTAVKSYPPNAWGLYEMHGNVYEWCQDWYGEYPSEPVTDPQGPDTGVRRVLRGGSWIHDGRHCRSANRDLDPSYRYSHNGFRLARGHELKPVRVLGRVQ